jgi:hypothetical protein
MITCSMAGIVGYPSQLYVKAITGRLQERHWPMGSLCTVDNPEYVTTSSRWHTLNAYTTSGHNNTALRETVPAYGLHVGRCCRALRMRATVARSSPVGYAICVVKYLGHVLKIWYKLCAGISYVLDTSRFIRHIRLLGSDRVHVAHVRQVFIQIRRFLQGSLAFCGTGWKEDRMASLFGSYHRVE